MDVKRPHATTGGTVDWTSMAVDRIYFAAVDWIFMAVDSSLHGCGQEQLLGIL